MGPGEYPGGTARGRSLEGTHLLDHWVTRVHFLTSTFLGLASYPKKRKYLFLHTRCTEILVTFPRNQSHSSQNVGSDPLVLSLRRSGNWVLTSTTPRRSSRSLMDHTTVWEDR